MIQHEQEGALDIEISWSFHLKAICFLGSGHPMPLSEKRGAEFTTITEATALNQHIEFMPCIPWQLVPPRLYL